MPNDHQMIINDHKWTTVPSQDLLFGCWEVLHISGMSNTHPWTGSKYASIQACSKHVQSIPLPSHLLQPWLVSRVNADFEALKLWGLWGFGGKEIMNKSKEPGLQSAWRYVAPSVAGQYGPSGDTANMHALHSIDENCIFLYFQLTSNALSQHKPNAWSSSKWKVLRLLHYTQKWKWQLLQ